MRLLPCLLVFAACAHESLRAADRRRRDTGRQARSPTTRRRPPTPPTRRRRRPSPPPSCAKRSCASTSSRAPTPRATARTGRTPGRAARRLERGHVYFVAAGSYPGYTFDDAADGDELHHGGPRHAGDHGTDAGWSDALRGASGVRPAGDCRAVYVVDGQDRGLVVRGTFQGTACGPRPTTSRPLARHRRRVREDGGNTPTGRAPPRHVRREPTDRRLRDPRRRRRRGGRLQCDQPVFEGNEVHALYACGTDGGCGPCYNGHSDGLELFDVRRRSGGNLVHDVRSTATFFFGNWGRPPSTTRTC